MKALYIIFIIFIIVLICAIYTDIEGYSNFYLEGKSNYANDIYGIRPPYEMSRYYEPEKIGPYRILKYNFLNYPIEG